MASSFITFSGPSSAVKSLRGIRYLLLATGIFGVLLLLVNPNYQWPTSSATQFQKFGRCEVPYGADFLQEWVAGSMLGSADAGQLYNVQVFSKWQHDAAKVGFEWPESDYYPAVYPPTYYLLTSGLSRLPYRWAVPIWLTLLLVAFVVAVWLIERQPLVDWSHLKTQPDDSGQPWKSPAITLYWSLILLWPAAFMGLVMGQKGTLWLLIAVAGWQQWRSGRAFAAGCIWSLMTMKPTLCCWLPLVMLLHGQWRFCLGVATGSAVLALASTCFVPLGLWEDFFTVAAGAGSYQGADGYRTGWSASLLSVYRSCGMGPRLAMIAWIVSAAVIVATLIRFPTCISAKEKLDRPSFMLRIMIVTALLSPHTYFYDLVWIAFPLRGLIASQPRLALSYWTCLWLGMLVGQHFEGGPPLLGFVLLVIFVHSTYRDNKLFSALRKHPVRSRTQAAMVELVPIQGRSGNQSAVSPSPAECC